MSFLEIDQSEFEKSLMINKDLQDEKDSIDSLISCYVNNKCNVPTKLVTPVPGFCVKTRTKKGEKIFINLCHTENLPKPEGFRIPMSIGNEKETSDKDGKTCAAFDVAVNSEFFQKLDPYNEVMMSTIIEAVADKHGLELNVNEFRILKNIKFKGNIQPMNIEQRPAKAYSSKKSLISEIDSNSTETEVPKIKPDFNLLVVDRSKEYYASEIDLKNVLSKDEVSLLVGEDRVHLTTSGKVKYELEYHFPKYVNIDTCSAEFDKENQVLTIIAPLLQ